MSLVSHENNSCGTTPTSLDVNNARSEIETAYAENKKIASGFTNKFAPVKSRYEDLLKERSSVEEDTNLESLAATMKCLTKFENNLGSRYLSSLGPGSGYNHE
jgi:archaellum component FlaC